MEVPPLLLNDVFALLVVGTIILLVTTELFTSFCGVNNLAIDRTKLRRVALTVTSFFFVAVTIEVITIIFPNL